MRACSSRNRFFRHLLQERLANQAVPKDQPAGASLFTEQDSLGHRRLECRSHRPGLGRERLEYLGRKRLPAYGSETKKLPAIRVQEFEPPLHPGTEPALDEVRQRFGVARGNAEALAFSDFQDLLGEQWSSTRPGAKPCRLFVVPPGATSSDELLELGRPEGLEFEALARALEVSERLLPSVRPSGQGSSERRRHHDLRIG
ncbi:MAG: hypothetical protein KatS3mg076_1067 [Candidatus Binatia bacterium]|nr:MAG: hypothetical protein KatS3mg076_1067 [Candidatus Binatia bacterium]